MTKGKSPIPGYHYKNKSLKDIKGEVWKDIPEYEEHYQISNYGRVKSLARIVENPLHGHLPIKERILTQSVGKRFNPYTKKYRMGLNVTLTYSTCRTGFGVARLVYFVFVQPFDLADPTLAVVTKNGDNFQLTPNNLRLVKKGQVQLRIYKQKERRKPVKLVSQYNRHGVLLKTYSSLMEAANETGYNHKHISLAANGHRKHSGGWLWRFGNRKKIKGVTFSLRHPHRIAQCMLNGKLIKEFSSIAEAYRLTGFTDIGIREVLKRKRDSYKGFLWKYMDEKSEM